MMLLVTKKNLHSSKEFQKKWVHCKRYFQRLCHGSAM